MWSRRLSSLVLFALLCAVLAYWVMQLRAPTPAIVPSGSVLPPPPVLDASLHARLFGGAVSANTSINIRVVGVVAPTIGAAPGIALLTIDDKPPRAYSTGQTIAPGAVLREVHADRVVLDQGGAQTELSVPQARPGTASSQGATPPGMPASTPAVPPPAVGQMPQR